MLADLRAWNAAVADPPALVVATSGSSGEPKQVLLSRPAMRASAAATSLRLGGDGVWVLALPWSYVAGLSVLLRSVVAGTEPVLLEEHDGLASAVDAMARGPRYISLVPTQLSRMLSGPPADVDALRRFDAILVGGAPLGARVRSAAEAEGVRVVATYGMSETCGGCVYDGVPLDGVEVMLRGDGRIRIAGPVLFDGYADQPELTAAVLHGGAFLTSDVGRLAADGRLEVTGRVDDVVISGGINVPVTVVARRILEHPDVRDTMVLGVRDEEWGQEVVAVVAVAPDRRLEVSELRDFVSRALPRSWAPRRLAVVSELPLLGNGKVDRRAVETIAAQATAGTTP